MNLYDLKSEEEWQGILDDLCKDLNMPTALVDSQSFVLQESGERHELCKLIRSKKDTLISICAQTQKYMAKEAKQKQRPVIVSCEAAMSKCLIPVFTNSEFLGSVVVCGTAIPGKSITASMIAESTQRSEDDINRLIQQVPEMDTEEVEDIANNIFDSIHSNSK